MIEKYVVQISDKTRFFDTIQGLRAFLTHIDDYTTFRDTTIDLGINIDVCTRNECRNFEESIKKELEIITEEYKVTLRQISGNGTTIRQKNSVRMCEDVLDIIFDGDIDNKKEVSLFLDKYLEEAKEIVHERVHIKF